MSGYRKLDWISVKKNEIVGWKKQSQRTGTNQTSLLARVESSGTATTEVQGTEPVWEMGRKTWEKPKAGQVKGTADKLQNVKLFEQQQQQQQKTPQNVTVTEKLQMLIFRNQLFRKLKYRV